MQPRRRKHETMRRGVYATKCMKYLTSLDYTTLEATGKNIEIEIIKGQRNWEFEGTNAIITSSDWTGCTKTDPTWILE